MNQKPLRLALNTVDAQRVEIIGQVINGQGWQILPFVAQPMRIDWLQQLQADLILIDLDLPNALAQVADLKRTLPNVPVLVLATQEHLVKLQDAFLAGAADFIAFPVDKSYFTATVQRVLQTRSSAALLPSPTKNSRMIAVTSLRGGAGRSTVAANLAIALHQHTKTETILTEAHHSMGHLSLMLNLHPRHTLANLAEGEHIDRDIVQAYLQQHSSGIRLLAAPTELTQLVDLTTETWRETLNLLAEIAPYVVVDTAATADDVLSEVLMRADDIVIISTPDIPGLRCTINLLETLRAEEAIRARVDIVLNRAGVRGGLDANMVQKQLKEKDFVTIPEDTPLATYALNRGVPFVLSHPRAVISRRMQTLVDNIVGHPANVAGEQKPKTSYGLLSLLPVSGNGKGGNAVMLVWMLLVSLVAGWLVNLVADTAPEHRSIQETWLWALCQLPAPLRQKLGLRETAANSQPYRPWRYFFVWCASLLLGWFAYQRSGFTVGGLVLAIQAWFFLTVAVIDLEHRRVLNSMLLAALPVIVIFDLINGLPSPLSALGGALTGFGLFLILALLRPGGIGMGDVKLAGVIGLATGFHGVIGAIMICMLTGGLAAAFVLLRQPKQRGQTMAYAPYLVIGAWAALYYGVSVWRF